MPYNEFLSDRIAQYFNEKHVPYYEKKMFGGLCFMVDEKMCVIVNRNKLMARINPNIHEESLTKNGCENMSFEGKRKPVEGYIILTEEATDLDEDLHYWLDLALDFNPLAKSSKKKTSK